MRLFKTDEAGIALALVLLCTGLSFACPEFFTADNLLTVARQFSVYGTIAVGMTFVIVAGEIDLSVGSVLALAGCLSARLVTEREWPLAAAMAAALAAGGMAGLLNGWLTVRLGIPSFIITLGMMSVVRGATYVLTQAMPISGLPDSYLFLGSGTVLGVTVPVVTMAVVALAGGILLARTRFGRAVYAVGGNLEAARLSGVATGRVRILCFTMLGTLSALAGMLVAGWVTVAQPVAGEGYELDVIASVIIGGASFSGGKGSVLGTMLGATLMGVLRNGLILLGVNVYWQKVAIGTVIVAAVMLDHLRRKG
jgi:ribose transport system permease protein